MVLDIFKWIANNRAVPVLGAKSPEISGIKRKREQTRGIRKPMKTKCSMLVALIAALTVQGQDSLTNGLIAFYPFSGNAKDASGNGNDATPAGNFQFLATNLLDGGGLRMNGDFSQFYFGGGYVGLAAFNSNLNSGFSASLWAKDEIAGVGSVVGAEAYVSFQSDTSDSAFKIW